VRRWPVAAGLACAVAGWTIAPLPAAQRTSEAIALAPERTSVFENGTVAVTRLRFLATAREEIHTHPFPVLIVQLTAGQLTVTDREMLRLGSRAGEVWFMPANIPHAVSNRSPGNIEILKLAIKPERLPAPAAPPTRASEGITRSTLVDNGDVRVVRVRFAPNAREPVHTHPNDVLTIQITSGKVEIVNGSERSTLDREPGFVQFVPRSVQHAHASADLKPFELLSVAFK
jgi:quercetin dioxygenase-like cupin family protein